MMHLSKRNRVGKPIDFRSADYTEVLSGCAGLLDAARRASARVVNSLMTTTYWEMGRRIAEHDQCGQDCAVYGEGLLARLSKDLTKMLRTGIQRRQS